MSVKITDKNNIPALLLGLNELSKKSVNVGVLGDEKMKIIAGANEFGAVIKSKKAIAYLRYLLGKFGKSSKVIEGSGKYKTSRQAGQKDVIIIPERSFLRSTADDKEVENKLVEQTRFYLYRFLTGKNPAREVLTRVGNLLKIFIQARIDSDTPPPNNPLTVRMKGHDRTLIGKTGNLQKGIDYEIV